MKYFFLALTLCFCCFFSLGQQSKIDSLIIRLKATIPDTDRVNTLNALAWELMYQNPDTSIILSKQAFAVAEKLPSSINYQPSSIFIGKSYHHLGVFTWLKGNYALALSYNFKALAIWEKIEKEIPSNNLSISNKKSKTFTNIGIIYGEQGDNTKALEYYFKALKMAEETSDKKTTSLDLGNIGNIYRGQGDYSKALDYDFKSLKMAEELGDKYGISRQLGNIGIIYEEQSVESTEMKAKVELANKALVYYFKALKIDEELRNKNGIALHFGNIGNVYGAQQKKQNSKVKNDSLVNLALEYYFKALKIEDELGDKAGIAINFGNIGELYIGQKKFKEAKDFIDKSLSIAKEIRDKVRCQDDYSHYSELDSTLGNYKAAFEHYKMYIIYRDSLFNEENTKKTVQTEMNYQFDKKEAVANAEHKSEMEKQNAIAEEKSRKQKMVIWSVIGGLLLVVLFAGFVFRSLRVTKKQKQIIEKEKQRSEELLLNILPAETAEELKLTGHAEPKQFDNVTVLFTDFKEFTAIAEKMSAKELVSELDFLFKKFDEIISMHPIEKIKTIGDSYMCAGGLPTANTTHAMDVTLAGLDIQQFIRSYNEQQTADNKPVFQIRIGIHTGPIVAGIVGIKKFAYDIWGDTVNTASRMESSGEAGRVNISETTYELLLQNKTSDKFNFSHRGEIEAKNKGKIKMYFVEAIRT